MMKGYLSSLKVRAAVELDRREAEKASHCATARAVPPKPLTDQITEFMLSLPPSQREREWAISDLVCRLHGRYRARPHPADVGQALRALGWSRRRDWTNAGGGRRVWSSEQRSSKTQ
jgi:hypothetical protein